MRFPQISTRTFISTAKDQIHRALEPLRDLKDEKDQPPAWAMSILSHVMGELEQASSTDDLRDFITMLDGAAGLAKRHAPPSSRAFFRTLDQVLDRLHKQFGEAS